MGALCGAATGMQRQSENLIRGLPCRRAYHPEAREAEIDRMLRAELFVDLYAVVRHAVRASVERYSIKDLEPFYGFKRDVELDDARTNLRVVERALELGATDAVTGEVRAAVEGYNRDDCDRFRRKAATQSERRWPRG
jgi:predicted RecB family nuclease